METIDWKLIKKSLCCELTPSEQATLDEWLNDASENRKLYDNSRKFYSAHQEPTLLLSQKEISENWKKFIAGKRARRSSMVKYGSVAAAVFLIFTTIYLLPPFKETPPPMVSNRTEGVIFTIEGDKCYNLNEKNSLKIGKDQISELIDDSRAKNVMTKNNVDNHKRATLKSNHNDIYKMTLEDGTKVWLNKSSTINFPISFQGNIREVTVTGEVYFEVAHDATKPFIVQTEQLKIRVLGTKFNVTGVSTALVEGAVEMELKETGQRVTLAPGMEGVIDPDNRSLVVKTIDSESVIAWTTNRMIMKDLSLEQIMARIGAKYGIEIRFMDDSLKESRYTLYTRDDATLEEMLTALCELNDITITRKDKTILINKKE